MEAEHDAAAANHGGGLDVVLGRQGRRGELGRAPNFVDSTYFLSWCVLHFALKESNLLFCPLIIVPNDNSSYLLAQGYCWTKR